MSFLKKYSKLWRFPALVATKLYVPVETLTVLKNTNNISLLKELSVHGTAVVTCAGSSMTPTILPEHRVSIRAAKKLRRGDVIAFHTLDESTVILHRIILILPWRGILIHCGDAPLAKPGITRKSQVLGASTIHHASPSLRQTIKALRYSIRKLLRGTGSWVRSSRNQ